MAVLMGSDIAKLVLGKNYIQWLRFRVIFDQILFRFPEYLRSEEQTDAYMAFCKNSPHLREEYEWIIKGYRCCQLFGVSLVDLLKESYEMKDCRKFLRFAQPTQPIVFNFFYYFIQFIRSFCHCH